MFNKYYTPIKNLFSKEDRDYLIEYFSKLDPSTSLKNQLRDKLDPDVRDLDTSDIWYFRPSEITDSIILKYLDIYGSYACCFMNVTNLKIHKDSTYLQGNGKSRNCVLNLPLTPDHMLYSDLYFYEDPMDHTPTDILHYNKDIWRPFLLNIDEWHAVNRIENPSLTFQLLYEDYNTAYEILKEKNLIEF